jgi:hypothetical protein
MAVYVVAYDFNREMNDSDRKRCREALKTLGWAKLSESSYAVQYAGSAVDLYNYVMASMDANDCLYVIPLSKPYAGQGGKEVIDWLNARL